jgi:Tfp pilus assembly protein PilF
MALGGCQSVKDFVDPLAADVVQELGLEDEIASSPDTKGATRYFEEAVAETPDSPDLRRQLAQAYAREGRSAEARDVYAAMAEADEASAEDYVEAALLDIELDRWDSALSTAGRVSAELDTPRRHLLDALLADHIGDWTTADRAYAAAIQRSPDPARMMNNWGVSLMARRSLAEAEATLLKAVALEPQLFAAKNNVAITRALRGDYALPPVALDDKERATLLYNMGLIAMRRGEKSAARKLFAEAVDINPRHFSAAARQLGTVTR